MSSDSSIRRRPSPPALAVTVLAALAFCFCALATYSESNISPNQAMAWGANIGWTNWRPDRTNGVQIGEFVCSGFVYSANVGWISLGSGHPTNSIRYQNNSAADFGVNVDQSGNLRGLAYGANVGWINFETNGAPRIDLRSGVLSGFIYGANIGWINLSNSIGFVKADSISSGTDSDSDGIPDAWELLRAGNLSTFSSSSDTDSDGVSDREEYLADTDPRNADDNLRILEFLTTPDHGRSQLTWNARSSRDYIVQDRLGFEPNHVWARIFSAPLTGKDGLLSASVTNPPSSSQRFFRIEAIRPLTP